MNTLPSTPPLIDRRTEVDCVARALAKLRPVAVTGAAGVGKTAVALAGAGSLSMRRGRSHRNRHVLWMAAAGECPTIADFARFLASSLNQPALTVTGTVDDAASIRRFLSQVPLLLVIDDLGSPDTDTEEEFIQLLTALPRSVRLVVSMGSGGPVLPFLTVQLDELGPSDALKLFNAKRVEFAPARGRSTATVENDLVAQALQFVGGNAEALTWLALESVLSPRGISATLDDLQDGTAALYDRIMASFWKAATPAERLMIAVVAGSRDPIEVGWITELLTRAGYKPDKHFLDNALTHRFVTRVSGERSLIAVPAIVRSYVNGEGGGHYAQEAYRTRLKLFAEWLTDDWEGAERIEPHAAQLVHALQAAVADGDCALFVEVFDAAYDVLFTLGLFDDRIELGKLAVACSESSGDFARAAVAWSVVATTHSIRGEYESAAKALAGEARAAMKAGSPAAQAYQMRCVAFDAFRRGDLDFADEMVAGSLAGLDAAGDERGAIDAVALALAIALHRDRIDEADGYAQQLRLRAVSAGWRRAECYALRGAAEVCLRRREHDSATKSLEAARAIASTYRDNRELTRIALSEGRNMLACGFRKEARGMFTKALDEARRLGLKNEAYEIVAHIRICGPIRSRRMRRRTVPGTLSGRPIGGD